MCLMCAGSSAVRGSKEAGIPLAVNDMRSRRVARSRDTPEKSSDTNIQVHSQSVQTPLVKFHVRIILFLNSRSRIFPPSFSSAFQSTFLFHDLYKIERKFSLHYFRSVIHRKWCLQKRKRLSKIVRLFRCGGTSFRFTFEHK